jgi:hypothetical protein
MKVRVYFKNPIGKKSQEQEMTRSQIDWNRKNKKSSPYKKIVIKR